MPLSTKQQPRAFAIATIVSGIAVICLFFVNLSYLCGSIYHQTSRRHALHVLMVDFDGGVIGTSMRLAYQNLRDSSFPTFEIGSPAKYPDENALLNAVKDRDYWAAFYSTAGASSRLSNALHNDTVAETYNASAALGYIWNEARYPASVESILQPSFQELTIATRSLYYSMNLSTTLSTLSHNSSAIAVFLNPIASSGINIKPTTHAARVLYNTVGMAIPIIQQFFFLMPFNVMCDKFGIYTSSSFKQPGSIRAAVSLTYTFIGSLVTTGYIWAFRESWDVSSNQFGLTWIMFWFLFHIYYMLLESLTLLLPIAAMPFIIVTFVFLSITSTNSPFDLAPGFYRWSYALPAFEVYDVLTDIWSGLSGKRLYRALPILFSWWIVGMTGTSLALSHKRKLSLQAAKTEAKNSGKDGMAVDSQGKEAVDDSLCGNVSSNEQVSNRGSKRRSNGANSSREHISMDSL